MTGGYYTVALALSIATFKCYSDILNSELSKRSLLAVNLWLSHHRMLNEVISNVRGNKRGRKHNSFHLFGQSEFSDTVASEGGKTSHELKG